MTDTEATTVLQISADDAIPLSPQYVNHVINSVFSDGPVQNFLKATFADGDTTYQNLDELIGALRGFFAQNLAETMKNANMGGLDLDVIAQAKHLAEFETRFNADAYRYRVHDKPNPDAVYWPNPTHPDVPKTLFETLPFVEPTPFLTRSSAIGSAGSCFASEIAYYLQNNGYNYVVAESDPRDGPLPESSARWGIIFNSPSFTQLAEKAFGLRGMPKLAEYHQDGYWQDPFRENISYDSVEQLEADRTPHIDACRSALETCECLIITLGLNECWEFVPDGTVASRNPKSREHVALFRHRVLSVEENLAYLQSFLDILRRYNPAIRIILSVSPVPFLATGLADTKHVVAANAHSKAVLRVVAETFVNDNEDVHYFPSYEMVMHCIEDPWEADQRHIKRDAVARIMGMFEAMFVKPEDGSDD